MSQRGLLDLSKPLTLSPFFYIQPGLVKGPWTKAEDDVVISMVQEHGVGSVKWSVIASHLPGRIGKQCRERWFNHLDPSLKKSRSKSFLLPHMRKALTLCSMCLYS